MKWEETKIGDCCEITSSKRIFYSEYTSSGVPFYRSKEIIQSFNGQEINEPLFISSEKYNEIKKRFGVPQCGDMLLTSVGTIGIPYIIKESDCFYFKDGNLTWFRNFADKMYSKYLYYWVQSSQGKGILNNTTIGSSQKALTISAIKEIKIPLPTFATQRCIAEILSAYDNLIKNNQKQIKLLEEAAMRLYKEWFVNLRFPGYETTKIVDGVPEEWQVVPLSEISSFKYGKMPKKEKIRDKGYPIFSGYRIVGYYDEYMFDEEMLIVIARGVGGTGEVKLSPKYSYLTNLSIVFLLNEEKYKYYLLQYFKNKNLRALDTGAAQSQITIENLRRYKVLIPQDTMLEKFKDFITPIRSEIETLEKNKNTLIEARDKLLPKLMSGEIEV